MTKPASVPGSHQEGGHSTEGTFCLLEDQRYIPCTLYMSHSERVTCFWLISLCHRYGTDDLDTSARSTSRIYPKPVISQNFPSQIISSASIASTANRSPHHIQNQHQENRACSIWSTWTSMARCHMSHSVVLRTSSVLLMTRLRRCGLTPSEPKIGCSRSSPIGSQWSKTRLVGN